MEKSITMTKGMTKYHINKCIGGRIVKKEVLIALCVWLLNYVV